MPSAQTSFSFSQTLSLSQFNVAPLKAKVSHMGLDWTGCFPRYVHRPIHKTQWAEWGWTALRGTTATSDHLKTPISDPPLQHSIHNISVPEHPRQLDRHVITFGCCSPVSLTAVHALYSVEQIHVQSQNAITKHFPFCHHASRRKDFT